MEDLLLEIIFKARGILKRTDELVFSSHEVNDDVSKFLKSEKFGGYSITQVGILGDLGGTLRDISNKHDDLRKEVNARLDLLSKIICALYFKYYSMDQDLKSFRGNTHLSIPVPKTTIELPKKGTPEYTEFLTSVGVPQEIIDSGMLNLSYESLAEFHAKAVSEGRDIRGLDKMRKYDHPSVTYRKLSSNCS